MESSKERYIPALGYSLLTPLYDPIVALTCREKTFKKKLLEQSDIQHGHKILDLGCGTGTFAVQIKNTIPETEVISIDGDSAVLDIASKKAMKEKVDIHFQCCLSTNLPFSNNTFDRVVSSLFFHHLNYAQKMKTTKEVFRVLKDGGQFHVADWGKSTNRLMRFLFYSIQILDGFNTTTDNINGRLPEIFQKCGFESTMICKNYSTVLGTMTLYSAIKQNVT